MKRDVLVAIDLQGEFVANLHERLSVRRVNDYLNLCLSIIDNAIEKGVYVIELNYAGYEVSNLNDKTTTLWKEQDDGGLEIRDHLEMKGIKPKHIYLMGINRTYCVARTANRLHETLKIRPRIIIPGCECKDYEANWGIVGIYGEESYRASSKRGAHNNPPDEKIVKPIPAKNGWQPIWLRDAEIEYGVLRRHNAKVGR